MLLTDVTAKELEILKEALPHATRIGVLWSPAMASHALALQAVETTREKLGVQVHMVPARTIEDFDSAFAAMARERLDHRFHEVCHKRGIHLGFQAPYMWPGAF